MRDRQEASERFQHSRWRHPKKNGRGHLVITAPTGGSAGVMPALVYGLLEVRKLDRQKIRDGMLAALGNRVSLQASCNAVRGRGRLPGKQRRGVVDGRGTDRYCVRRRIAWW